jgi:hypothetical protein
MNSTDNQAQPLTDRIERSTMEGRIDFWVQSALAAAARAAVVSEDAARLAA